MIANLQLVAAGLLHLGSQFLRMGALARRVPAKKSAVFTGRILVCFIEESLKTHHFPLKNHQFDIKLTHPSPGMLQGHPGASPAMDPRGRW